MKFHLILSVLVLFADPGFGSLELRNLSDDLVRGEFSYLGEVWRAVGLLQAECPTCPTCPTCPKQGSTTTIKSGFFIAPDLFLTSRYSNEKAKFECDKISIATGFFHVEGKDFPRQYSCKEIVKEEPSYGFMIIRIKENHRYTIPLPDGKERFSYRSGGVFDLLGYAIDGHLFYSQRCRINRPNMDSIPGTDAKIERGTLGEILCLSRTSMAGGPILQRIGNSWRAIGILSNYVTGKLAADTFESSLFVKFPTLQEVFGKDLIR